MADLGSTDIADGRSSRGMVSIIARHPNAANLIMVLMILFGVFSLGRINTQFFPTIEIPNVTVTVTWSGASAEDIEAEYPANHRTGSAVR